MRTLKEWGLWLLIALAGAAAFGTLALHRGESINAIWLITAAVSCYLIAYRFYSRFIANKVLELNGQRLTPAVRHNDGLDYVPTNKWVLFGHHFAAIAGAGPLVGPVLAAQMGYLPGTLWILVGVMFAGAVQDFIVLFISTRRAGVVGKQCDGVGARASRIGCDIGSCATNAAQRRRLLVLSAARPDAELARAFTELAFFTRITSINAGAMKIRLAQYR